MSHFTTVKTEIRDLGMLRKALTNLGYRNIKERDFVRGYRGNTQMADLVIKNDNGYDVGFVKNGAGYDIVADFWGVKVNGFRTNTEKFTNEIIQRYAYETIKEQAEIQGFSVAEESVQKDGTIKIVVQRWT